MSDKNEKNLAYAFAAESKAAARNATFARKADMENYTQIARLFRAVSDAESVHARRYLMLMRGKIGSTEENLETAFQNEIQANVEEYPKLIKEAADEGSKSALKAFSQARDVESLHAELYKKAINAMIAAASPQHFLGIDPQGTHAHSMVQLFMAMGEGEIGAFRAYAATYPTECVLLVDTIDTLSSGVPNAIVVFDELRAQGHRPLGIRLDSGDLAHLAVDVRLLRAAGHGQPRRQNWDNHDSHGLPPRWAVGVWTFTPARPVRTTSKRDVAAAGAHGDPLAGGSHLDAAEFFYDVLKSDHSDQYLGYI